MDDILDSIYVAPRGGGKPECLAVLCHGIHADSSQLRGLVEVWRGILPKVGFLLPHAPWRRRHHWLGAFLPKRREWFGLQDKSLVAYEIGVRSAAALLDRSIDAELSRLGLPADAYLLAGYSQGAMLALFAGLRRGAPPRAIIGIAGALIAPEKLASEMRNKAPVMLLHGADDRIVPLSLSETAVRILTGYDVVVKTLFRSGLAHELDEIEIRESALFLKRIL